MEEFQPITDSPESFDSEEDAVASTAKARDHKIQQKRKRFLLVFFVIIAIILLFFVDASRSRLLVSVFIAYGILRGGIAVLGALSRPIPEPPPPGELRKVKLVYRCSSCGGEMRMTLANQQVPEAPRHCGDFMDLLTRSEDI